MTTESALAVEAIRNLSDEAGSIVQSISIDRPGLSGTFPVLLDRKTGRVHSVKAALEEYRDRPHNKTGVAQVYTLDSFIDLVMRHRTENSVIFADTDWRAPSLTAVIDYHDLDYDGPADNCRHRIHYKFPLSEEWKAWVGQDSQTMDQTEFAQWIEDHLPELATPTADEIQELDEQFGLAVAAPNAMVSLSRGLQVHVASRVKANTVLNSGEGQILFEEEHHDSSGNKLAVPGLFIVSLAPFFMGMTCRMPVRLRYRVSGGTVKWHFKLFRPDVYITRQIDEALMTAANSTTLPYYRGTPEIHVPA